MNERFSWRAYLLTAAASFLTVLLALLAGTLALTDAFALSVEVEGLVCLCALSALVSAAVYSVPRVSLRVGLLCVVCGVLALLAWWRWEEVAAGAQILFHQVSYGFHEELPSLLYYELPREFSRGYQQQAAAVFLQLAVPLLALWLGPWLTLSWPVWPAVSAVAAMVGAPLLILRQPGPLALGLFLLFLSLTILSRRGYRERPVTGAGRVLASALPVALTLVLLGGVVPLVGDTARPLWLEDLRLAIQRIPSEGFTLGMGGAGQAAPGEQSFRTAGPLHFRGRTVLQINSSSAQNPLYLRGFSAGAYTADGWMPIEDHGDPYPLAQQPGSQGQTALFPYLTQPYQNTETVRITDMGSPSNYYYLPYYPSALPGDAVSMEDAYVERPSDVAEYHISFLPTGRADLTATLSTDGEAAASYSSESQYRQWVYSHYLDVPYDLLSADAAALIRDFAASVRSGDAPADLARSLRAYLASFTEYDQSTPYTPENEDFVSYFLTESHRGYCVHYASSAVLFLRACGIPARYAAGYVARPGRASAVTNVPDRNAHAWVEVYVDGFGWQPADVTPGFSGGGNLGDLAVTDPEVSPSPSSAPSAPPSPTPTPASQAPSPTPAPAHTSPGKTPALYLRSAFVIPALILLCACVLLAACVLQSHLRRIRLRRRCTQPDPNQATLQLYRYLAALERHAGLPIPPDALALAQKAHFSQHTISEEELQTMRKMAQNAAEQGKKLPLRRRILLRFVWAIL